jgi:RimJ/RimL family protein N-acetyltransferase
LDWTVHVASSVPNESQEVEIAVVEHVEEARPIVRWIRSDELEVYREFRLRALAEAPYAFSDSLAAARSRPESFWVDRVAQTSAGVTSVLFVAVEPSTDRWLGMTGCYLEVRDPPDAMVVSVWVDPVARGQGLAGRLVLAARDWARERGVRRLMLWVVATNEPARRVYEAAGFVYTGTKHPLPSDPSLDELEMAMSL